MPSYRIGNARIFVDTAALRAFARDDPEIRAGVQAAADEVAADATRLAPVGSQAESTAGHEPGTLRRSIGTERLVRSGNESATVRVVARVFYARFVEFGTRYMRARPFMRPAANAHRPTRKPTGG